MDFLLKKKPARVTVRIPSETKDFIQTICELKGMNESQYVNLALENQIKSDIGNYKTKQTLNQPTNDTTNH